MLVKLKKRWFSPDGIRYRPGEYDFPNDWEKKLPKTAEILSKTKAKTEE